MSAFTVLDEGWDEEPAALVDDAAPGWHQGDDELVLVSLEAGDSLALLFRNLRHLAVLTLAEEFELARRVGDGDREARTKLLLHNLRLIVFVVKRYCGNGVPLVDLIQEGYLGLSRAVDKFDYRRGYKFLTHATVWIRRACLRVLPAQAGAVALPEQINVRRRMLQRTSTELMVRLGREPTDAELAAATAIEPNHVNEALTAARVTDSLDADRPDGTGPLFRIADAGLEDPVEDVERSRLRQAAREALATLEPTGRSILEPRFGLTGDRAHSLSEVAARLGLSPDRVRRHEPEALQTVKPRLAYLIGSAG